MPNTMPVLWVMRVITYLAGIFAFVIGAVLIIGGDTRMAAPSYVGAVTLAHSVGLNPPLAWGIAAICAGFCVLASPRVGLFVLAVWCMFFGLCNGWAAATDPHAGMTGLVVYTFEALSLMWIGACYPPRRRHATRT